MRVYLASSWRNSEHPRVVEMLRGAGHEVYDFKRDEGASFHWSEAGVNFAAETFEGFTQGLRHPRAIQGFNSDFGALQRCDACVLLLPCGRSAHLELGWAAGRGKLTAILFEEKPGVLPELMYKMVDRLSPSFADLAYWLKLKENRA